MKRNVIKTTGDVYSVPRFVRFSRGKREPGIHWIGGWAALRADLDAMRKKILLHLPGIEVRFLSLPANNIVIIPAKLSGLTFLSQLRMLTVTPPLPKYLHGDVFN